LVTSQILKNPLRERKGRLTYSLAKGDSHRLLIEDETKNKKQTLYFPLPITCFDVSENELTLIAAADTLLFCFKKDKLEDKYQLMWDDGDALTCQGVILDNVIDLSDENKMVFEQHGAKSASLENNVRTLPLASTEEKSQSLRLHDITQPETQLKEKKLFLQQAEEKLKQEEEKMRQEVEKIRQEREKLRLEEKKIRQAEEKLRQEAEKIRQEGELIRQAKIQLLQQEKKLLKEKLASSSVPEKREKSHTPL